MIILHMLNNGLEFGGSKIVGIRSVGTIGGEGGLG
jgi:hypothetical protein